jgi:uncharacterized SAM-binding protein YcdF (DUF218 family)
VYPILDHLLRPFVLLYLLLGLALLRVWRKQPEARRRLRAPAVLYLVLLVVASPATGYLALGSLEWQYPPAEGRPEGVGAVVVLGGGVLEPNTVRPKAEMDAMSMARTLRAAELYRRGKPCLVIASGGKPDPTSPGPACADLMGALLREMGVAEADLLVENHSRTTYENAAESAALLRERGVTRVALVTDAGHLPRAVACFRKQGLDVVPVGCQYRATEWRTEVGSFLPGGGLGACQEAAHEWLGLLWYRIRGRA